MTPFIFFFSSSCFFAGLLCLLVGGLVLRKSRNLLHVLYFLMTLVLFEIGWTETHVHIAASPEVAYFWTILTTAGWGILFPLYLHFVLVFAWMKFKLVHLIFVYAPALLMFLLFSLTPYYVSHYEKFYYGYNYIPGPWNPSFVLYYLAYVLLCLYLVWGVYRKGKEFYRRRQAQIFLITPLFPLIIGTISNQILITLRLPTLPLAIHSIALVIGFLGYAILRYQPVVKLAEEEVAEAVARALQDPMFLTDAKKKINFANPAACRLSGLRADELMGKDLAQILPQAREKISDLLKKKGAALKVSVGIYAISGNRGYVVLARDLSSIARIRESIQSMNVRLKEMIGREEKIMKWLFELSEQKDPSLVELLWKKIQEERTETRAALGPVHDLMLEYTKVFAEVEKARETVQEKVREIERLNQLMEGREEILKGLQTEYERLKR